MKTSINTFEGGLVKDINPNVVSSNQYIDANDITILGNGKDASARPVDGSRKMAVLIGDDAYGNLFDFNEKDYSEFLNVMGAVSCNVILNGEKLEGLVTFVSRAESLNVNANPIVRTSDVDLFEIYLSTIDQDGTIGSFQKVYVKEYDSSLELLTKKVDGELSDEGNIDVVYFTNQADVPMRIRCTLDEFTMSKPLFLDQDIILLREANMQPPVPSVSTGGNLTCGTYQFAVRMYSSDSNLYTKWSLLSNPIPVYNKIEILSTNFPSGGIGEISDKKIRVSCTFNSNIKNNYNHFQLAVVKGTDGTGIPKLNAFTIEPRAKGTSSSVVVDYSGEEIESEITIEELTVDDAQIASFNTIAIKNNFLIGGNINYANLELDNGTPIVSNSTNTEVTRSSISGTGKFNAHRTSYTNNSLSGGLSYFRDEVYRFAIVYHDKNGNWSSPSVLDFSSATDNNISGSAIDWKFPSLEDEPITENSENYIHRLGLNIDGIQNHPSWATGFAILRAKRIKDIKAQAPLYPTQFVQPMIATTLYPQGGDPLVETAQPPEDPFGTIVPKNLINGEGTPKHIMRGPTHCQYYYGYPESVGTQEFPPQDGVDEITQGNSAAGCQYINCIFIPNNVYNNGGVNYEPYLHKSSDTIEIVDIQNLKGEITNALGDVEKIIKYGTLGFADAGMFSNYTSQLSDNYTNRDKSNTSLSSLSFINNSNNRILQYEDVEAGQSGVPFTVDVDGLISSKFGSYSDLDADGLNEGTTPTNQRMGFIVTSDSAEDPTLKFFDSAAAINAEVSGSPFDDLDGFTNEGDSARVLTDLTEPDPNYIKSPNNALVPSYQKVSIVNIRSGVSDLRYGGSEASHEFVFTGSYVALSSSDVSGNVTKDVTVYGGDCTIDLHSFKVHDSTYSLPNNGEYEDANDPNDGVLRRKYMKEGWGNSFLEGDAVGSRDYETGRPIPIKANSGVISVFLESEFRATAIDRSQIAAMRGDNSKARIDRSITSARTPYFYNFNLDYCLPNYNKVFLPTPILEDPRTDFPSRLAYSDQRIYQSTEIGFDRFRVANIYDMDESRGEITRLVNSLDRVYGLQSNGVSYIPIQAQTLETSDASTLSVRSAEVIGIPQYISTIYGTTEFNSVAQTPYGFIFADRFNGSILKYNGESLSPISHIGMRDYFKDKLEEVSASLSDIDIFGVYDTNNSQYIIASESPSNWMVAFSDITNTWISEYTAIDDTYYCLGGAYTPRGLYMVGKFNDIDLGLHRLRTTGNPTDQMLGTEKDPRLKILINEDKSTPKVFDNLIINSYPKLDSLNMRTYNTYDIAETSKVNYQEFGTNIEASDLREGTYRIQALRDESGNEIGTRGSRMRGLYGEVEFFWNPFVSQSQEEVPLFSVMTKYRISDRRY